MEGKTNIKSRDRAVVNVGSVGQPRDRNPQGCFVVFDDEEKSIEFCRFDYDFKVTQEKIRKAGLPERLADRLSEGK